MKTGQNHASEGSRQTLQFALLIAGLAGTVPIAVVAIFVGGVWLLLK